MKKTREDKEIRDLDELFERYRQAPDSYVFVPLADACRKMGRIEEALEICESGVQRHPAYPSGHVVKGKCLFDKNDRKGARETFERVLMLDENNLVALKYLGMIEADDGDFLAARKHFRHILSLDPENKEIKAILNIVSEQEPPVETPEESSADIMEGVDEILSASADEDEPGLEDEAARDATAGPDEGCEDAGAKRSGEELETSDELASVTLAEIFASQGYRSKAEKIYREVLRRQPGNEELRKRLRDLAPDEPDAEARTENDRVQGATREREVGPEVVNLQRVEDRTYPVEGAGEGQDAPVIPAGTQSLTEAGSENPDAGSEAEPGLTRSEISERDSLGHFKRWLTRMHK